MEILERMQADMANMKTDMAGMKTDMAGMKTDMAGMKERIDQIDVRSQRTAVLMETEVERKLKLNDYGISGQAGYQGPGGKAGG